MVFIYFAKSPLFFELSNKFRYMQRTVEGGKTRRTERRRERTMQSSASLRKEDARKPSERKRGKRKEAERVREIENCKESKERKRCNEK